MEKQLSCCWYRYVKIFFLFYIRIEFLPGHASITLDPRCKVPTGQHILSIGPGYGLAPNATVTAEVSNKTIVMLWMLSYITVYYLTSSKLEWNKDSLQRGECWVTADAEYAVVLVLSKLAFFPSCPWHISSKPAWTSVSLQANILYWFAPRWCVTLLQPLRPALISHLEFVPAGPDVSLNKVPSSLLKCTPSNEVSIPSTHLPNEKFMCFFFSDSSSCCMWKQRSLEVPTMLCRYAPRSPPPRRSTWTEPSCQTEPLSPPSPLSSLDSNWIAVQVNLRNKLPVCARSGMHQDT